MGARRGVLAQAAIGPLFRVLPSALVPTFDEPTPDYYEVVKVLFAPGHQSATRTALLPIQDVEEAIWTASTLRFNRDRTEAVDGAWVVDVIYLDGTRSAPLGLIERKVTVTPP